MLASRGAKAGETVAVIDYDSYRYLESFFAIPMIGAALHTVNYRLSPEQVLYTINHAEDDVIFLHVDFLPLIEGIKDKITTVKNMYFLALMEHCLPPHSRMKVSTKIYFKSNQMRTIFKILMKIQ